MDATEWFGPMAYVGCIINASKKLELQIRNHQGKQFAKSLNVECRSGTAIYVPSITQNGGNTEILCT